MYQESLNQRAQRHIPGGVNSPVRAFSQVGVEPPIFAASAKGAVLTDVEGKSYVDYIGAWGPMILGHADADVVAAVQAAPLRGLGFGMATEAEVELAELLCKACPSLEMVRLVNSGTEATMSAIRLARGYTKRPRLIKFEGCYHGHADHLLVKAGSGLATFSTAGSTPSAAPNSAPSSAPSSLGVSQEVSDSTMVLPFNDLAVVEQTLKKIGDQVAALILEPVVGNMGLVPPQPGYLQGLRRLCDQYGVVYIFDEVMTGFRLAYGGAQELYNIKPDLTTFSKIIGGGLPVGAYGGRAEIMRHIAPLGNVYQAGTLSGNPVTVAAGLATLRKLKSWRHPQSGQGAYDYLETLGKRFEEQLTEPLKKYASQLCLQRVGSMWTIFFSMAPVRNWSESSRGDHSPKGPYARFFQQLLKRGILFPPSSYEAAFLSLAHTPEIIDQTAVAINEALGEALGETL